MPYTTNTPGESDLEREYELSFEHGADVDEEHDMPEGLDNEYADDELETGETDLAGEFEALREMDDDGGDQELSGSGYGQRLYELSLREFESESQQTAAVLGELEAMGEEYFLGTLARRLKKSGRGLLNKATRMARSLPAMQAIKGFTQLARNGLKGQLGSLITSAMASAIPGGAMALPALRSLGIKLPGGTPDRETYDQLAEISREAFEHLAETVDEEANNPLRAGQLATAALQAGVRRAGGRGRTGRGRAGGGAVRRITLRRGERLVISVE
jgi:hypothetical protein